MTSSASDALTRERLAALLLEAGVSDTPLDRVEVRGADPVLETHFRVGEAAAVALAGCGALAARLHEQRGGEPQDVAVDVTAAAASLLSFAFLRNESSASEGYSDRQNITDFYPSRDGRFVLVHGGFAHLQQGILDLLEVVSTQPAPKAEVAAAIAGWDAGDLERAIAEAGMCGALVRSEKEWREHPQGQTLAGLGSVEVIRTGDAPPMPLPPLGSRPLEGIRVLDLTRVLAGPVCARTLAAHGAEVLKVTGPALPSIPLFVRDTGHGKRSCHLDLRDLRDAETLRDLIGQADVFSQGYRLGALARRGFDLESVQALRPGIVYVSIDCYGHEGPWRDRPGWEQLAQTVTGVADEQGASFGDGSRPRLLPAAATDYTTGYLAALGTLAALLRRAVEGGSYHVRVSLAQTAMWLQSLGRCDGEPTGLGAERLAPWLTSSNTHEGRLHHLGPVISMSGTPARWEQPTAPLGAHPGAWAESAV